MISNYGEKQSTIFAKQSIGDVWQGLYPAGNYMFKINKKSTRTRCEICLMLAIKRHRSGVFIVNFEHISHLFQFIYIYIHTLLYYFFINFKQVNTGWVNTLLVLDLQSLYSEKSSKLLVNTPLTLQDLKRDSISKRFWKVFQSSYLP